MNGLNGFDQALKDMLVHEGEYALVPGDRGGETYRGIARNVWPKWSGWAAVDRVIDEHFNGERRPTVSRNVLRTRKLNKMLRETPELQSAVDFFYLENFWRANRVHEMPARVACKVFNMAVNIGRGGAGKVLQRALNSLGAGIAVDGVIGPKTIGAVKRVVDSYGNGGGTDAGEAVLVRAICRIQADYYRGIVERNPSQKKFLKGWLRRAEYMGA